MMKILVKKMLMRLGFKFKTICGHYVGRKISGMSNGIKVSARTVIGRDGKIIICDKCFIRLCVPCAVCSLPIAPGDRITLHMPAQAHGGSLTVKGCRVGCLRCTMQEHVGFLIPSADFSVPAIMLVKDQYEIAEIIRKSRKADYGCSKIIRPPSPDCN